MEVPSTPTAYDKTMELKNIADQIAVLASKKEHFNREATGSAQAATLAQERLNDLIQTFETMSSTIVEASKETREFIAHCGLVMTESETKVLEMIRMAHVVEQKAINAIDILKKAKIAADQIHDYTVSENKALDQKRLDLDIYYNRLKEYFDIHLPDQIISI